MNISTLEKVKASALMRGVSCPERLLECFDARVKKFVKSEEIIGYGDKSSIIIITRGNAIAVNEDWFGNRNIISKLGESEIFGAAFVFSESEVSSRLVATENGEAVILGGNKLHRACAKGCADHTAFIYNALKIVAGSCVGFLEKVEHLSRRSMREKILSFLSTQSIKNGSDSFAVPYSRQELADYLAVDRCALSSELGRMRDEGLIRFRKSQFEILK